MKKKNLRLLNNLTTLFLIILAIFIFHFNIIHSFKGSLAVFRCPPNKKYCAEEYRIPCGPNNIGYQECFKEGCNDTGGGGPSCPWAPGSKSRCGECILPDQSPLPTPTPQTRCFALNTQSSKEERFFFSFNIKNKGLNVLGETSEEPGRCLNPGDGRCEPVCSNSWSENPNQPNLECRTLTCSDCQNTNLCCRKVASQENPITNQPSPPSQSPQTPALPTRPPPTATPIPPTPTPTYIEITLTPTPPGQTNPFNDPNRQAQSWFCLQSSFYDGPIKPGGKSDHRLKLLGSGLPRQKDIYIVSCVSTQNGTRCTTGNDQLDRFLRIQKATSHQFIVNGQNPIQTSTGNIEIIVYSSTQDTLVHAFYAVFFSSAQEIGGRDRSPQYGTFDFAYASNKKCIAIYWDPFGRVFDSQTLEPIPNVKVFLSDKRGNLINRMGIINPYFTEENGFFSFFVGPGEYQLIVEPPKDYLFTHNPKLHPLYHLAYSNLYQPGKIIIEKDQPIHTDVPLLPKEKGKYFPLKQLNYAQLPSNNPEYIKIVGQVTHPLTLVVLKQQNKIIAQKVADKMGYFEFDLKKDKIKPSEKIIPYFIKKQYPQVEERTKNKNFWSIILDLFTNIFKGKPTKAFDSQIGEGFEVPPKEIIANVGNPASIKIILSMSNNTYLEKQTDINGKIILTNQEIPPFSFFIEIEALNQKKTLSLSEFIRLYGQNH